MRRKKRIILKQSLKYFFIVILFLTGVLIWTVLWEIPTKFRIIGLLICVGVLVVSIIFDLLSMKDIIPIFKR